MNIRQFVRNGLIIGGIASATSALAALAGGRHTVGKALPPLNAVSHIAWGGAPPRNEGRGAINTLMGALLRTGACVFWASIYDVLFARGARRDPARIARWSGKDSRDSLCHRLLRCLQAVPARIRGLPESCVDVRSICGARSRHCVGCSVNRA